MICILQRGPFLYHYSLPFILCIALWAPCLASDPSTHDDTGHTGRWGQSVFISGLFVWSVAVVVSEWCGSDGHVLQHVAWLAISSSAFSEMISASALFLLYGWGCYKGDQNAAYPVVPCILSMWGEDSSLLTKLRVCYWSQLEQATPLFLYLCGGLMTLSVNKWEHLYWLTTASPYFRYHWECCTRETQTHTLLTSLERMTEEADS